MGNAIPLISVLMGVYYRREDLGLLQRAVDSVLCQTENSFEFLICDDGSLPSAQQYLEACAEKDSRIRLIRGVSNTALAAKLNACLRAAKGTYIARMDDDDYSVPERFVKQAAFLQEHPQISFVGSNVRLIQNNEFAGVRKLPEHPAVRDFYFVQPYIHPALMFRKKALTDVGGYSESSSCLLCEDYDLLLRLYGNGCTGANLQGLLLDYTVFDNAGKRMMRHRWNECVTRYQRFRELNVLPKAWPYVLKPLLVGLVPSAVLRKCKAVVYAKNSA